MSERRNFVRAFTIGLLTALTLAACGSGDDLGASPIASLELKTLSNRADMISDGDALMEVVLPQGVKGADVHVDVNGTDETSHFVVRADGRMTGVVTGLPEGESVVSARLKTPNISGARLTLTNHSRGESIFAGEPIQPWVCATKVPKPVTVTVPGTGLSGTVTTRASGLDADPVDADCNAPTKFSYYYMAKAKEGTSCTFTVTGASACFQPYDPKARPKDADIADMTTDRGDKVKALLRVELGTMARGEYQIVAMFDPAQPWSAMQPQKGWNRKVWWSMGGSATGYRFQDQPGANGTGSDPFNDEALRAGFITVSSELTDHISNNNDMLATQAIMMIKEHIIDTYGEIRYVIGNGGSGGSTMQTVPDSIMPGLLDGLTLGISFPDTVTIWTETRDCQILTNFYATVAGSSFSSAQQAAINGHPTADHCRNWVASYPTQQAPTLPVNCGEGFPASIVYDPKTRPNGVRCTIHDVLVSVYGTAVDKDGITKTSLPYDNHGVQYGLAALQAGQITVEQFVMLNEGIGSLNLDSVWTGGATAANVPAARSNATASTVAAVYKSGLLQNARNLAGVPIIDIRLELGANIHMAWRSFAQRAKLDAANGGHANQVIWGTDTVSPNFNALVPKDAFAVMDRWLAGMEADKSADAKSVKVVRNKPADAVDSCWTGVGTTTVPIFSNSARHVAGPTSSLNDVGFGTAACPIKPYKSPRIVAGEPATDDIISCQLKPLDFSSVDYVGKTFTSIQQARMRAVFPEGVCDWSKPSVGYQPWTPTTFKDGAAGATLPAAPVSQPL